MKESAKQAWMRVYYGVLIVCGLGLVLAVLGLFLKQDPLYYAGLLLAAPLFLIVLPLCILLIVLMYVLLPVTGFCALRGWLRRSAGKDSKTGDQPTTRGA